MQPGSRVARSGSRAQSRQPLQHSLQHLHVADDHVDGSDTAGFGMISKSDLRTFDHHPQRRDRLIAVIREFSDCGRPPSSAAHHAIISADGR